MPGLDCKQVLCLEQLRSKLRAVDRIDRIDDISDDDRETIITCVENAASDLDKILSNYT